MTTTAAEAVIARLGLHPHPEGGWYAETWRAEAADGDRPSASAILYLLAAGERSHWHRVDAAEIWQYSAGDVLELRTWVGDGAAVGTHRLGAGEGEMPQVVVPAGAWQAARPRVRSAIAALGDRMVSMTGPDGRELLDLVEAPSSHGDTEAPVRFLARWDSVLIGYDVRDRILPDAYRAAVIKKNGDFLPTVLVDGLVAGLWTVASTRGEAVLTISPFATLSAAVRRDLEAEGDSSHGSLNPRRPGTPWRGRRQPDRGISPARRTSRTASPCSSGPTSGRAHR